MDDIPYTFPWHVFLTVSGMFLRIWVYFLLATISWWFNWQRTNQSPWFSAANLSGDIQSDQTTQKWEQQIPMLLTGTGKWGNESQCDSPFQSISLRFHPFIPYNFAGKKLFTPTDHWGAPTEVLKQNGLSWRRWPPPKCGPVGLVGKPQMLNWWNLCCPQLLWWRGVWLKESSECVGGRLGIHGKYQIWTEILINESPKHRQRSPFVRLTNMKEA